MCSAARRLRDLGAPTRRWSCCCQPPFLPVCRIAWIHRDALLDWIGGGPEPVATIAPPTEPDLAVAVDSAALIEDLPAGIDRLSALAAGLADREPYLRRPLFRSRTCRAPPRTGGPRGHAGALAARARPRRAPAPPTRRTTPVALVRRVRGRCARLGGPRRWPPCCASSRPSARPYSWRFAVLSTASLAFEGRGSTTSAARRVAGPSGSSIPARCRALPINSARPPASLVSRSPGWIAALNGSWRLHGRPVAPVAMARAEFREPARAPASNSEQVSKRGGNP